MKPYNKFELKQLIAHAEIQEVIGLMAEIPELLETEELLIELANLKKEYKNIQRQERMGLLGYLEVSKAQNKITWGLLAVLDQLP